jgi:hypothetical protein
MFVVTSLVENIPQIVLDEQLIRSTKSHESNTISQTIFVEQVIEPVNLRRSTNTLSQI